MAAIGNSMYKYVQALTVCQPDESHMEAGTL